MSWPKGKPCYPNTKLKIGSALRGRPSYARTIETKEKLREAAIKQWVIGY